MKKYSKWIFVACVVTAGVLIAFRWIGRIGLDERKTSLSTIAPVVIHEMKPDKEHEILALKEDLTRNPKHIPVLLRLAQVSREVGRLDETTRYLKEAVAQEESNRDARLELGRVLFETGDVAGAIRETQILLEKNPSDVDALYNLGAIYGNLNQDDRAKQYFEKVVAVAPDSQSGKLARDGLKQLTGPK